MRAAARANTIGGMSRNSNRLIIGWFLVLLGAAAALLIAWLGHIVSVPVTTLLTVGAAIVALSWRVRGQLMSNSLPSGSFIPTA
jgi:hypothetical protein